MNPSEFISEYLECFGSGAPLPLAVIYTDNLWGSLGISKAVCSSNL